MTEHLRRAGQVCWALVGVAALLAVLGMLAWTVRVVFPPLILAGVIVFLLNPVVTALQHRGVPRAAGAGLAYAALLGLTTLSGVLLFPLAADQVDELAEEWPDIRERVERWVDDRAAESEGTFWEFTRDDLEGAFSNNGRSFEDQLRQVRRIGVQVFHALVVVVLAPIIAFYLLVDVPHTRRVAESLIPPVARAEVMAVAHRLNRTIGGFFRGQLVVAVLVGLLCSLLLGLINLKFWFLVGMIAGLFNVIPLIGPWVGGIPGVAIALTTGSPVKALAVVVIMAAVQQLDNHFITPQVMQRTVHLHPAVIMLSLLAGGTIGGFFGLFLAVPVAAVLKILISHVWRVHVLGEPFEEVAVEAAAEEAAQEPGIVEDVAAQEENQGERDAEPVAG